MKIGVVGHTGMVGGSVNRWMKKQGHKLLVYSKDKGRFEGKVRLGSMAEVNKAEIIFVCVPTPFSWDKNTFDLSIVRSVVGQIELGKTVVLKSTMWPGSTEDFQKEFPKLFILFNPEFLSESTADADFSHPDRQFVGYTKKSYTKATEVLNVLPESPADRVMPATEAEILKYINNMHGVLEVLESNHYYEVCEKLDVDYDRVIKNAVTSKWMGPIMGRHYRVIWHKNYRGVGGVCFPKDLAAWIQFGRKIGVDTQLFKAARKMNQRILAEQNLTEQQAEKK